MLKMPHRFSPVVSFFAPLLAFVVACGDVEVAHKPPPPIGVGGSAGASTGGTGGSKPGGTGGGIGVGGSGNMGGSGDEGGSGSNLEAVCGNDRLEPGELCDDGNTQNDDGCSADCSETDPDYLCTEGQGCVRVVTCGNGVIEGDEICDDRNTDDDDGCSANCDAIDDGFICAKPGEPCVEKPVCGNGVREQGEQCDDHDDDDDDGCDSACQLEDGWFCPPGDSCVPLTCGDGNRTPDEQCEDGNTDDGDGCAPDCTVEPGFLCSTSGCKPICGDGLVLGSEKCDDNNAMSGDGCSSACKIEPFYACDDAEPSVCTSTIVCGDGILSPGEICDPGIAGQSACYGTAQGASACKGYDTGVVDPPVCNNGFVEYMEECDGNVQGCTNCQVDDGFVCPAPNNCFRLPVCGDGFLQAGEQCDLGLVSGPGCIDCEIQPNYFCSGEPSVCVASVCGDKLRAPDEQCDDGPGTAGNPGTPVGGDGCSATCTLEPGYACPPGRACLAICGDGVRTGTEECDPTPANAAACKNCKLQPGYKCGTNGQGPCAATACANAAKPANPAGSGTYLAPGSAAYIAAAKLAAEPGEGCDDGNTIAGDGCGPTCQLEPQVKPGATREVDLACGDGLVTGTEECDDGNTTNGDGCSYNATDATKSCKIESGWKCDPLTTYPASINFRVVYRDFKMRSDNNGHPHMRDPNGNPPNAGNDSGIAGGLCTTTTVNDADLTDCDRLDAEGKPQYAGGSHPTITGGSTASAQYNVNAFALWYRDTNTTVEDYASEIGASTRLVDIMANPGLTAGQQDTLQLDKVAGTTDVYQFSRSGNQFYPLGSSSNPTVASRGYGSTTGYTKNYHFTSELRYFFQYKGGETLLFYGDDDVFVFVNGRLAVDIGGIHTTRNGRVVLGDDGADGSATQGSCDINIDDNNSTANIAIDACGLENAEKNEANPTDKRFGLVKGGVYEIVVFQAERQPVESNYRLTLAGFLAPRSNCYTDCGDSIVAGSEMCDDGRSMPASGYNKCLNTCTIQFCGDKLTNGTEECDNGANAEIYGTTGCAPGCKLPTKCGDGILQASFGEECDKGNANQNGLYGGCSTTCKLGPYCGDGIQNGSETCDPPDHVFATYGAGKCNYNCQAAPYCGDGVRNGAEQCDGSANCNANCEYDPFCGDGLKSMDEPCDNGMFNYMGDVADAPYGSCTNLCQLGPYCGDEALQEASGEECDEGTDNADNVYDGCTTSCTFGPHCGDGIYQQAAGEACDNGFNEDDYAYPGATNACGKGCKAVPYCGDGKLASAFELCDDGSDNDDDAYDGCTTRCDWGPYCGDGQKNGPEQCDDGADNKAYSADGKGCSYECKKNLPYCGDGVRNGPEQCDDGTNDGSYGTCNSDCSRAPYCGDGQVQKDFAEQCDDGPTGSLKCSPTCKRRDEVPK